jgi:prepilin-type processing-associated H-X9-DG protein
VLIIVLVVVLVIVLAGCLLLGIPCLFGTAVTLPAVQQAREAARRTQSRNNLQQTGIAMHTFHDAQGHWVGGTTGPDGEGLHSWQTHLLPYLDHAPLYQSIDQELAWDDPAHGDVFRTVILPYQHPSQAEFYTPEGFSISHYAGNVNVLLDDSQFTLGDVTDGTSHTIAAGEVTAGFRAWGDPSNLRDPADGFGLSAHQFGSSSAGGANMLFMDGSVRFISENINPDVLKALSTPDGGENVGAF